MLTRDAGIAPGPVQHKAPARFTLRGLLRSLLPGIFLFGFCIGTGSVTAMATAGADYGMALLWTVFLSCVITFFLVDLYGKFTLVTGETALAAFRRHIHSAVGYFFIVTLTAHVCGSVIGVMGILADVSYQWSRTLVAGGVPPLTFAGFFLSAVYVLLLDGRTRVFQQTLAAIVSVMSICFLLNKLPPEGGRLCARLKVAPAPPACGSLFIGGTCGPASPTCSAGSKQPLRPDPLKADRLRRWVETWRVGLNLYFVAPPAGDILRGLVPQVPETTGGRSAFLVIASMVGTTVFSGLFTLRGSLVRDAGWTLAEYRVQRRDAAFAAAMMFLVSAAVMAAGAGTLHARGIPLNTVSEMITLLQPVAGAFAVGIFVVGIVAAGVSPQFPNVTLLPWLLNDYYQRPSTMRRPTTG